MEDSIAVSVQNVSKKFRLFGSPKDRLREALHPFKRKYHHEFWALKDITFDVPKGMTLGIIGRNGSGKSTLLQMICSVLTPTSGTLAVNGRISALLELGAGFNPEFTGRDNVILNGALMGFSRSKMEERLPLIEKFADIGEFIDQPVKTYSSGMFVRLAFAAAINVDPDILIVDEALAVGDAKFQHKCYNKFLEFQKSGKTILFVTHDMNAITKHCDNAILLENGVVMERGKPNDVVNRYFKIILMGDSFDDVKTVPDRSAFVETVTSQTERHQKTELDRFLEEIPTKDNCIHRNSYNKNEYRFGDRRAEVLDYFLVSGDNYDPVTINSGDTVDIYLKTKFHEFLESPIVGFSIKTIDGIAVYASNTRYSDITIAPVQKSDIIIFKFSMKLDLHPGDFFIDLGVAEKFPDKEDPIDVRYSMVHIFVKPKSYIFDGLADFGVNSKEVLRKSSKVLL